MKQKILVTWGIIFVLLVSVFGTAGAQTGPEVPPQPDPTEPTITYVHPIAQILGAYFGRDKGETTVEVTPDTDPLANPDPLAPAEPTDDVKTPEEIAAEITMYHQEGMGFGVLVKLYAMAEASAEKCADETLDPAAAPAADGTAPEACKVMTVDELVTAFQGGQGMGQLFKEYGKPALLGVGHVKKELKKMEQVEAPTDEVTDDETIAEPADTTETELENGQGQGNGNRQGNGNGNSNKDKAPKQKGPKKP